MKKYTTLLILIAFCAITTFAQTPEKLSYQAIIRNTENKVLANTKVAMQISILESSADGTVVYVENQTPTSNKNGLITIQIGGGNTSDDFSLINWSNGPHFVKTEIDPDGGSNYTIIGVSQLLSVPYALHAKTAESISGTIKENQDLQLDDNQLTITNKESATTIDLSKYLDDTKLSSRQVVTIVEDEGFVRNSILKDNNASNEIQDLTLTDNNLKVTNNKSATTIDLSKYLDDTKLSNAEVKSIVSSEGYIKASDLKDDDASNEIQDLTLTGNNLKVTNNTSATTVDLSKYLDDTKLSNAEVKSIVSSEGYIKTSDLKDNDATNEIQNLSLSSGNKLYMSGSKTVIDLSRFLDDTVLSRSQVYSIVKDCGFADRIKLRNYVLKSDLKDDDATNEIQELTLSGDKLKISQSGKEIDLSKYNTSAKLTVDEVGNMVATKGYVHETQLDKYATKIHVSNFYATKEDMSEKASLDGARFTGAVILPKHAYGVTPDVDDNSTKIATTAYVDRAVPKHISGVINSYNHKKYPTGSHGEFFVKHEKTGEYEIGFRYSGTLTVSLFDNGRYETKATSIIAGISGSFRTWVVKIKDKDGNPIDEDFSFIYSQTIFE